MQIAISNTGVLVGPLEAQYKCQMQSLEIRRVSVLGSLYSCLRNEEVRKTLIAHALAKSGSYVCVSNVHTTMMGFWDEKYRSITNKSFLSVPDGMPLVVAMKLLGEKKQDRVRGPTLMKDICRDGVSLGCRHYLFGSTPATLLALKTQLEKNYPGIQIVGQESPPFRPLSQDENKSILERVQKSDAHFMWVGLGAPKQENWMSENSQKSGALMVGVGAAFDLLAGKIPEAPEILQKWSLEWAFRLYKEPARLWRRYLYHNPAFVFLFVLQCAGRVLKSLIHTGREST